MSEFHPTLFFAFALREKETVLHQMWSTDTGVSEWRPVPMLELGPKKRKASISGFIPENEEE